MMSCWVSKTKKTSEYDLTASSPEFPAELTGEPTPQPAHQEGGANHGTQEVRLLQQELWQRGGEVLLQPQTLWQVQQRQVQQG